MRGELKAQVTVAVASHPLSDTSSSVVVELALMWACVSQVSEVFVDDATHCQTLHENDDKCKNEAREHVAVNVRQIRNVWQSIRDHT